MNIVIHGTKGGYRLITPERVSGLFDARPDYSKVAAIGQQAYAIHFTNGNIVFSKYRIIRDAIGDLRTGNIAFSIAMHKNKRLISSDIQSLLDKVAKEYCSKYIVGDNLDNVREDWTFVTALANQYESRLSNVLADNTESCQQGAAEAAFVYYSTGAELQKYFDAPYQEEYSSYRQVFFVERRFENAPENPLNALRHDPKANLTGKIDLENPKYKLLFNSMAKGGVRIDVKVNGSPCSSRNKIRRKNELEITWSKRYYQTVTKTGSWNEIDSEFISVDDKAETVTIKEIDLHPVTYNFNFKTQDRESNKLDDAEIILKVGEQRERKIENYSVRLTEEDMQNRCVVVAKKDNDLISKLREIKVGDIAGNIVLILQEHKTIEFEVKNEDRQPVSNVRLSVQNKDGIKIIDNKKIEFIGEAIERDCLYTISADDYESKSDTLYPRSTESKITILLKKRNNSKQQSTNPNVSAGEYRTSNSNNDSDVTKKNKKEPFYIKSEFIAFSAIGIAIIAVLCSISLLSKYGSFGKMQIQHNKFMLNKLQKNANNLDSLNLYKIFWNNQPHEIKKGSLLSFIGLGEAKFDSTDYKQWEEMDQKIDEAIAKAEEANKKQEIINYLEGNELKSGVLEKYLKDTTIVESLKLRIEQCRTLRGWLNAGKVFTIKRSGYTYSTAQKPLEEAMKKIDDTKLETVSSAMFNAEISKMNLDKIAEFIIGIIESSNGGSSGSERRNSSSVNTSSSKVPSGNAGTGSSNAKKSSDNSSTSPLETDFWKLVHDGNVTKESYDALLREHSSKSDDIVAYLREICKSSKEFGKFKNIREKTRKNAKILTDIKI
jgi:hypothetical protein